MGRACVVARSVMTGCSSRQGGHQDAHTFNSHTLPFISCGVNVSSADANGGNVKLGAGLLIRGEGTSLGFSVKPTARKPTRTEEHTSELQSLMRSRYDVFCSKKKNKDKKAQNVLSEQIE